MASKYDDLLRLKEDLSLQAWGEATVWGSPSRNTTEAVEAAEAAVRSYERVRGGYHYELFEAPMPGTRQMASGWVRLWNDTQTPE